MNNEPSHVAFARIDAEDGRASSATIVSALLRTLDDQSRKLNAQALRIEALREVIEDLTPLMASDPEYQEQFGDLRHRP